MDCATKLVGAFGYFMVFGDPWLRHYLGPDLQM